MMKAEREYLHEKADPKDNRHSSGDRVDWITSAAWWISD
jgi:hypothetical protein